MKPCPDIISKARVICYTPIDDRHRFTGACKQMIRGKLMGPMAGLAVCKYDNAQGFYLFGCDQNWQSVTDTWHQTLEDAMYQAEFEYEGVAKTWVFAELGSLPQGNPAMPGDESGVTKEPPPVN